MVRRLLTIIVIAGLIVLTPAYAANLSSSLNSDTIKYEFARSYITSLSYIKQIYVRWNKDSPKKLFAHDKYKMIKATINDLALDNSDLRVIKGYLIKYMTSPNKLIRKVADIVVVATSSEIAVNDDEKKLWQKWYDLNVAGQAVRAKEIEFVKAQYAMEMRRKELDKEIVKASVLMTKVLMSDKNKDAKGHLLAITSVQRQKLLDILDSFGGETLDWGLKAGQRTLESSIAVIREILEDSIWISIDEK